MAWALIRAVIVNCLLALVHVLIFDVLKNGVQANGSLARERKRECILQDAILLAEKVVKIAINDRARLRSFLDLIILFRHINDVGTGPQVHIVEDQASLWIAGAVVQHVKHS